MCVTLNAAALLAALALVQPASADTVATSFPAERPVISRYEMNLTPNLNSGELSAACRLTFTNPTDSELAEIPLLLHRLLTVDFVKNTEGHDVTFEQRVISFTDWDRMQVNHIIITPSTPLAPGETLTLELDYHGYLCGYTESGMLYVQDRIDTTFSLIRMDAFAYPQIGYPSWKSNRAAGLPVYDYRVTVTAPRGYTVANGGKLADLSETDSAVTFTYQNSKPAWRMDFAIARYLTLESDGHRVYCFPADSAGGARILATMRRTLDSYTKRFGPLGGDARFTVLEIPDGWGSQADVTSIIQTAAAFTAEARSYELYHEISHLWNVRATESFPPRWEEGLAMFLQYRTAAEFGELSLDSALAASIASVNRVFEKKPEYQTVAPVNYGAENMTDMSYRVGLLLFATLHELVGAETFDTIIGEYYARYHDSGANTQQFTELAEQLAPQDLSAFFADWMYSARFSERVTTTQSVADLAIPYR